MQHSNLEWSCRPYAELDRDELYAMLRLRARVFIVEQQCAYLDLDDWDQRAWHIFGKDASGRVFAYLRLTAPGTRFAEPSIGRVVTDPSVRGLGLGRTLMHKGLDTATRLYRSKPLRVAAQMRLESFYREFGFRRVGNPYDEDGIAHVGMIRFPRSTQNPNSTLPQGTLPA